MLHGIEHARGFHLAIKFKHELNDLTQMFFTDRFVVERQLGWNDFIEQHAADGCFQERRGAFREFGHVIEADFDAFFERDFSALIGKLGFSNI